MKTRTIWKEKMVFSAEADGNQIEIDAKSPIGTGKALTPKELLAIAVSGCSAMDVAALMKKHGQPMTHFEVVADITVKEGSKPQVFSNILLTFSLSGNLDREKALEAVKLSQTKYCGVSAMVVGAVTIQYKVRLNDEEIGAGSADFSAESR